MSGKEQRRLDLAELERPALEAALVERGQDAFRGDQIFRWIHRRGVTDVGAMTDLPLDLRRRLADEFVLTTPTLAHREKSSDGTEKFLLRLADGRHIESVFIPDTPSMTFCISTQVGCAMACAFCLTGKMGLVRNLTAGEIVGQVRVLAGALDMRETPFNIVLMGMGEPLHNYDETMKALRILADPQGLRGAAAARHAVDRRAAAGARTAGDASRSCRTSPSRCTRRPTGCAVNWSRSTRSTASREIIAACQRFPLQKRRRITFEYVLLAGVNDSPQDARLLAKLLARVKSKVNLIPLNAAPGHSVRAAVRRSGRIASRRSSPMPA